ncbi:hypothetical protein [Furfurilactobacillus rossiae]|nr:hypothetical protein [Furfurilactobacillus rossiae]QFR66955.1 hypothetical protein LR814_07525 [Furfurilactobacillus rossiae]QLE62455.1 hypothetical protein LROSRS0_2410 [Furfurilactobacillus rossiae]
MKKSKAIKYFQAINGRKPSESELESILKRDTLVPYTSSSRIFLWCYLFVGVLSGAIFLYGLYIILGNSALSARRLIVFLGTGIFLIFGFSITYFCKAKTSKALIVLNSFILIVSIILCFIDGQLVQQYKGVLNNINEMKMELADQQKLVNLEFDAGYLFKVQVYKNTDNDKTVDFKGPEVSALNAYMKVISNHQKQIQKSREVFALNGGQLLFDFANNNYAPDEGGHYVAQWERDGFVKFSAGAAIENKWWAVYKFGNVVANYYKIENGGYFQPSPGQLTKAESPAVPLSVESGFDKGDCEKIVKNSLYSGKVTETQIESDYDDVN